MTAPICTCGQARVCPQTCAGAQLQELECVLHGHQTARSIHERAWGEPPAWFADYCYRCGETTPS